MQDKTFKYILWLIGISTLLLFVLQAKWLADSYKLTKHNFNEAVKQSMNNAMDVLSQEQQKTIFTVDGDLGTIWKYQSEDKRFKFNFYAFDRLRNTPKFDDGFYKSLETLKSAFEVRTRAKKDIEEFVTVIYGQADTVENEFYQRINVDSVIRSNFKKNNLDIEYYFGFLKENKKSFAYVGGVKPRDTVTLLKTKYVFKSEDMPNLHLVFQNEDHYLMDKFYVNIISSTLLILIVLFSMWYAFKVIMRQKTISQIKTDFINNMTHELKTPLASIGMAASAIEEPNVVVNQEKIKLFTKIIKEENNRMNSQIELLLDVARTDANLQKIDKTPVDIKAVIDKIIAKAQLVVDQRQGKLSFDNRASQTVVNGSEIHLYQAVNNLIDNAIKYSPTELDVRICLKNEENHLLIEITDQGLGILKKDEKLIFEKFYRVNTKNIHRIKGFGLGLNYVKSIAEAHDGKIALRRNTKGSTFTLYLPLKNN